MEGRCAVKIKEVLDDLAVHRIELWVDGSKLHYKGPNNALTADKLSQIQSLKSDILEYLMTENYCFRSYKLSHGQQGLWFLYQASPMNCAYNAAFAARMYSKVDIAAMRRAIQRLTARHELLRATFGYQGEEVYQFIHAYQQVVLEETVAKDWTEKKLCERVATSHQRAFDLEHGPVFRVHFFHLSDMEHVFLFSLHHIICDGWSLWILINELKQLYVEETTGKASSLAKLYCSYSDFVEWQSKIVLGVNGNKLKKFWVDRFENESFTLNFPTDFPRPPVQTFNGGTHHFICSETLGVKLKNLAKEQGVTLYVLLLSAFQLLLNGYITENRFIMGSPVTGRSRGEFNAIVGHFINMVVHVCDTSNNPTFLSFVKHNAHRLVEMIAHQDYPFDLLVKSLNVQRDSSLAPIFQVMFVLQKPQAKSDISNLLTIKGKEDAWGQLRLKAYPLDQQEGQFDISLEMIESNENEIYGQFHYNRDLFEPSTIDRMVEHFITLLEGIVASPNAHLSDLSLISQAERHRILFEWNQNLIEYPKNDLIHQLFEQRVALTPNQVAVVFEGSCLTYQELNIQANQIAHHLIQLEVGPEAIVGVRMKRSPKLIIGLMGILKAGGAYLPLDPDYPHDRLAFMLEDAKVSVLLTEFDLQNQFSRIDIPKIVNLNNDWNEITNQGSENPEVRLRADNLAYVIYTSGSTGKPKGVAIEHRSTVALTHWALDHFGPSFFSGMLCSTSICFDLSVFEIFTTLGCGGKIILIENAMHLPDCKHRDEVTVINTVPSIIRELEINKVIPNSVFALLLAGEPLKTDLVNKLYKIPNIKFVYDLYGPSEDTTYTTCALRKENARETIGRPIANTQVYIADKYLRSVPIGALGEIYIGGEGLARGYLNREELTQKKFIPNPFIEEISGRVYKTGDLACFQPDGNIRFFGRIDHQVKIRGFRIELNEIEKILQGHPAVFESVVVARKKSYGNDQLLAYIVVNDEFSLGMDDFRLFLKTKLPGYMIPNEIVPLEKLPLTPNGKIDRKALPSPSIFNEEKETTKPRTNTEALIVEIWRSVMKLENIGVNDNFFNLGGNSLLLLSLHRKLEERFPGLLKIMDFMEFQTVSDLAQYIDSMKESKTISSRRSIQLNNFYESIKDLNFRKDIVVSSSDASLSRAAMNSNYHNLAYQHESKVVFCNNVVASEILFAMNLVPFNVEMSCGFLTMAGMSQQFIDSAEEKHIGRDICSISRCAMGTAFHDCLPTPDAVAITSHPCESSPKVLYNLSKYYEVPWLFLDIPFQDNEASVRYLEDQIKNMVKRLEEIFDKKIDQKNLIKAIQYSNIVQRYLLKINSLCTTNQTTLFVKDAMDLASSFYMLGSKELADVTKTIYEDINRMNNKEPTSALPQKKRILWHGLRPSYSDEIIKYIEEECGFKLISEVNLLATSVYNFQQMEEHTPYRSIARRLISMSASAPIDYFFHEDNLDVLSHYKIDGVLSFNQWGCRHMLSVHQIARGLLKTRNIPVLEIDGDYLDERNYSFAPIKTRIDAFVEILNER